MIKYERIPQWVRDYGAVAVGSIGAWVGLGFVHDLTVPWWLPVLIMLGVRILDRIAQTGAEVRSPRGRRAVVVVTRCCDSSGVWSIPRALVRRFTCTH